MFIKSVSVRGFRAAAVEDFTCELPGRFALLVGGNNAGKTTVCESIYRVVVVRALGELFQERLHP